jgi:hypothetical protein
MSILLAASPTKLLIAIATYYEGLVSGSSSSSSSSNYCFQVVGRV